MRPKSPNSETLGQAKQSLRAKAEETLSRHPPPTSLRPVAELVHELQVHQIELEMQNAELREAHVAAEEARDRYVDLFEFSPVGYIAINRNARISEMNLTGAALLGEARSKLLNCRFSKFVSPFDKNRWHRLFMRLMRHSEAEKQALDLEMLHVDGSAFYAQLICLRRHAMGGPPVLRLTLADVTERKRAEKERQTRIKALEESRKELETVSFSVSHDLQIPLRAIDGFVSILQDEYKSQLAGEGERYLNAVRRNTSRMSKLINGLLDFISLSQREIHGRLVDMGALAREVFEELRAVTPERVIWLRVGDFPPAYCDPEMMRRALENLLENAIKFTTLQTEAIIEIGSTEADDENTYFVRDNGVGFDMRYVDKLFGVGLRLHSPDEFEGPGIGLAIVKRIVGRYGGRVWAESKEGQGATFYFTLPRTKPDELTEDAGNAV